MSENENENATEPLSLDGNNLVPANTSDDGRESSTDEQRGEELRLGDCGMFLDDFACEVAEYDDKNRCIKYTHAETQPDDAMHAANYALQIATRGFLKITESQNW